MAPSFFERLTGMSTPDEPETPASPQPTPPSQPAPAEPQTPAILVTAVNEPESPAPQTPRPTTKKEDWLQEPEGQLTIDVYQTPADIVIKSTIAGVTRDNLDISITNDMITIKGKRERDEHPTDDQYYYQECYWGAFSRSVILPVDIKVEETEAILNNGILTVRLPKAEKEKSKRISVKTI
ncbi:Hsp20/alpha crystallin family protein [Candidatus Parcubacteria bacterium]|nr:Hsp20/alpha crystallin family protein [Candidatus Parcubacteria bacterium]